MSDFDVIVIGAGAAGIAAARALSQSDRSFVVLEAADRIGGRAWTRTIEGMPLDLGCGWLHSADRNPWVAVADALGVAIDRTDPAWAEQYRELGFSRAEQAAANADWERFDRRLRDDPPASDRAADALDAGARWNAMIQARSTYVNGAALEALSVRDYLAYDDAATDENWRLPGGYGALIAQAGQGLPIRLGCEVVRIDRTGSRVRVETNAGTLGAGAVIVTVSSAVLASGRLRFDPSLDDALDAAAQLPLGLADKLFLAIDGATDIDADRHLIGNPRSAETGSYYLRPFARPLIEGFFGAGAAVMLEKEGLAGASAFTAEELGQLFGSDFPKQLRPLAFSCWRGAELIQGSYSHALPGHADARALLSRPWDDRIIFAGEACSPHDFSTAHGAYATGVAAARRLLSGSAASAPPPEGA